MERGIGIQSRFLLLFQDDDEMAVGIGRSPIDRAVFFGGDGFEPAALKDRFVPRGRTGAKQQNKQQEWEGRLSLGFHAGPDSGAIHGAFIKTGGCREVTPCVAHDEGVVKNRPVPPFP
jgi:hypothetical protein